MEEDIIPIENSINSNDYLIGILKKNQIRIERTFYCPHVKEDNCECKKPKIKFIREIVDGWNVDINNSWVIGDHPSDILFGINAGCNTVYMSTGHGERHLNELEVEGITPIYISNNFLKVALEIIRVK